MMENKSREELLETIKKLIEDELKDFIQPVSEMISSEAKDKTKAWHQNINGYIEEYPVQSVGFAFLAGFVIARLFYRGKN